MAFTATARVPNRPLSYAKIAEAMPKEISVDYTTGEIYVVDEQKKVYCVTESIFNKITSPAFDISKHILITLPDKTTVTLDASINGLLTDVGALKTTAGNLQTSIDSLNEFKTLISSAFIITPAVGATPASIKLKPEFIAQDATNRLVTDSQITDWTSRIFLVTVGTVWTGTEAPFTQVINVPGILAKHTPIVDILLDSATETFKSTMELLDAYANIYRITTSDGSIKVYSTKAIVKELRLQMKIN